MSSGGGPALFHQQGLFAHDHVKPRADGDGDADRGDAIGQVVEYDKAHQGCHRDFQVLHRRQGGTR